MKEVRGDRWIPVQVYRGGSKISSLFFADDVVLFAKATREQALLVRACLYRFCQASGQRIGVSKSRVYFSPNTKEDVVDKICTSLDIERTSDLGKYLGVPTINGKVTRVTFHEMLHRADKRLAGWETKCLSMAGRATLISSTISAIPAHVMQPTWVPRSICDELDRKTRRFLWGGTPGERKTHLVAWDVITKPKENGGPGLWSMHQLNSALMMKLAWKLRTDSDGLWAQVLMRKYCNGVDVLPRSVRSDASNTWNGIMENKDALQQNIGHAIGDGMRTFF